MKLEWLKEIIGEGYTEEMDGKAAAALGTRFVAKEDFNQINQAKKQAEEAIAQRDIQLGKLKKDMEAGEDFKAKFTALEEEIQKERQAAEAEKAAAAAEAEYKKRFDSLVGENKWRDELTANAVYDQFKKALAEDGNKGKGDSELFTAMTQDKGYFQDTGKTPVFTSSTAAGQTGENTSPFSFHFTGIRPQGNGNQG